MLVFSAASLLSSCASREPIICGNASFSLHLSPEKPIGRHPVDSRGDIRLVSAHRDGRAIFELIQSGTRFTLGPGGSYSNPQLTDVTITLHASDPDESRAFVTSQIVP